MANSFDDVPGACFPLGANHRCTFGNAAEGFAQVSAAANEGDGKVVFIDVVRFVSGGENLGGWKSTVAVSMGNKMPHVWGIADGFRLVDACGQGSVSLLKQCFVQSE